MKFDVEFRDAQGDPVQFDTHAATLVIWARDGFRDMRLNFAFPVKGRKQIRGSVGQPWNSDFTFAGNVTALKKLLRDSPTCASAIQDKRLVLF